MRKRVDYNIYNIGSNIRTARKRAGLTQEELSECLGVTPQYLSDLERGLVGTSIPTLMQICITLNVSSDFILFGGGPEEDKANSTLIERIQRLPSFKADIVETGLNVILEALELDPEKQTYK